MRPWLRWRFPNITVHVDSFGRDTGSKQTSGYPPMSVRLVTMNVHITNAEVDRKGKHQGDYLLIRAKPEAPFYKHLFIKPFGQ